MASRALARWRKSALTGGKWLWTNHPEIAVGSVVALLSYIPAMYFFVYRQWYLRGTVSYYKPRYIVWRPDDPHVQFIHPPGHFPPPHLTIRDNNDLVNPEKDY